MGGASPGIRPLGGVSGGADPRHIESATRLADQFAWTVALCSAPHIGVWSLTHVTKARMVAANLIATNIKLAGRAQVNHHDHRAPSPSTATRKEGAVNIATVPK